MLICKRRKSQVLSPDFIMSIIIFSVILGLGIMLWNTSCEKLTRYDDTEQMQKKVLYVSDILLNTQGVPQNWNTTNVIMVGLKENNTDILDTDKIISFKMLEYNHSKEVLGLGSYEYFINITDPNGGPLKVSGAITGTAAVFARDNNDNIIKQLLENYYDEWDYYWAGPGTPSHNARTMYNSSDATPPNERGLFTMLMSNLSSYDTVIIEAENSFDIDAADKAALKNFVDSGGILIDIKDKKNAQMINHFPGIPDGDAADNSDETGTMIKKDILLVGRDIGETVTFESHKFRFSISDVDKAIVESDGHSGTCVVCLWYYGNGKIYYLPDGSDDSGDPIDGMDMDGIELVFGSNETTQAENIVPVKRFILVRNGQDIQRGIMTLYIYK